MTGREIEEEFAPTLPGISEGEILVIRSTRRKKSASAYRQGGRIVISIPARLSKADERAIVPEMIAKIRSQEEAKTPGEADLIARIDQLLAEYQRRLREQTERHDGGPRPLHRRRHERLREQAGGPAAAGARGARLRSGEGGPRDAVRFRRAGLSARAPRPAPHRRGLQRESLLRPPRGPPPLRTPRRSAVRCSSSPATGPPPAPALGSTRAAWTLGLSPGEQRHCRARCGVWRCAGAQS